MTKLDHYTKTTDYFKIRYWLAENDMKFTTERVSRFPDITVLEDKWTFTNTKDVLAFTLVWEWK